MDFTLYCLRRGGASWCFEIDISMEAIRLMGNWASNSYKDYIDLTVDKRLRAALRFDEKINQIQS